jgi:integrase
MPTFKEVYEQWFKEGQTRNADPWRPATAATYKSQLETNVLPVLGGMPIETVGNKAVKSLVSGMVAKKLAPASIQLIINCIKGIRGFLTDDDGQPIYPYVWSARVIDAPTVDKRQQKRPVASAQAVQDGLSCTAKGSPHTQVLLALLAGSGLRIQEAMALHIGGTEHTRWLPEESKIIVRDQRNDDGAFVPVKTDAGEREVDLCSALNDFLVAQFATHHHPMVPMFTKSEAYYRGHLKHCGINGGFHSLRRFRVTYLLGQGVPEPMVHYWVGHEDGSVTGRYNEVSTIITQRKELAEKAGLGFTL